MEDRRAPSGAAEIEMPVTFSTPILVVDDLPLMTDIIVKVAKLAGFEDVDHVDSAPAAMAALRERDYGLIISDIEMEGMSGLELLKWVREREELQHVLFMMITANERHSYVTDAAQRGVDAFLVKPFSPAKLKEKLRAIVNQKRRH